MRLTVMRNMAKSLPEYECLRDVLVDLERTKWYLWHGNVYRALEVLYFIEMDLEMVEEEDEAARKLLNTVTDFSQYISINREFIPNYGERYRYGETISTAFAESTVNWVVSKRMVKKQQMRWTKPGAHLLLQVRTKTLNKVLRDTFCNWYPAMTQTVRDIPYAV
jgi:hypothetical protein